MKKFVVLALGLVLVGGVVSGGVSASRMAYHQYVKKHVAENTQAPVSHHSRVKFASRMHSAEQLYRYVVTGSMRRGPVVGYELNDAYTEFATYENNSFSLQVPSQWLPEHPQSHKFISRRDTYTVNVKVFDAEVCAHARSLQTCASNLSENENYQTLSGRGKHTVVSPVTTMAQYQNTVLNSSDQTMTYTESFMVEQYGEDWYINRYFVQGLDGRVFMVETRADGDRVEEFLGVSKIIFDSFRVYGSSDQVNAF